MSGTRLALRLAAREARRRLARSVLVAVLVAIPVAGMTIATTLIRTADESPAEAFAHDHGTADVVLQGTTDEQAATLAATLPSGSTSTTLQTWYRGVRTAEATAAFTELVAGELDSPVLGGRYRALEGAFPATAGQVALSATLADRFDVGVGDRLSLEVPALEADVVGIVESRTDLDVEGLYFGPEPPSVLSEVFEPASVTLVDVPGTLTAETARQLLGAMEAGELSYLELRPEGPVAEVLAARTASSGSSAEVAVRWSIVAGALVLAVVGIVIAAAFTVGARQQLTTLGQLDSNGAPVELRRRMLTLQGTVTGLAGAVAGVVVGVVATRAAQGWFESLANRRFTGVTTRLSDVVVIAAVGVIGATIAARIPARSAARIAPLEALAGRRPEQPVSHRFTVGGTACFVAGLALLSVAATGGRSGTDGNLWASVAVVGGLGVLFGATAVTPALVAALAPLTRWSSGTARLAFRNLTRNRTRTGAVVAAVAAAGALAVAGSTVARLSDDSVAFTSLPDDVVLLTAVDFSDPEVTTYVAPPERDVAQVAGALEDAERFDVPSVVTPLGVGEAEGAGFPDRTALMVDDGLAEAVALDGGLREALQRDGIAVVAFVDDGLEQSIVVDVGGSSVPAERIFSASSLNIGAGTYVTPEFVAEHGLDTRPGPVVFASAAPLTEVELFDLTEIQQSAYAAHDTALSSAVPGPPETMVQMDFRTPDGTISTRIVEAALAAVAVVLALIVLAIGLALASADDRDEATTMAVVGADPDVRTRIVATKAWAMAVLGFVLAIPIGYLPVRVIRSAESFEAPAPFPSAQVLVLVIVAPLVGAAVTAAVTAVGSRLRPIRVSTAMFE